jgi:hypothetical protein
MTLQKAQEGSRRFKKVPEVYRRCQKMPEADS